MLHLSLPPLAPMSSRWLVFRGGSPESSVPHPTISLWWTLGDGELWVGRGGVDSLFSTSECLGSDYYRGGEVARMPFPGLGKGRSQGVCSV